MYIVIIYNLCYFFCLGMEVETYLRDGMIEKWDLFERMLDYTYDKYVMSDSQYHPVLFSEASVSNSQK